MVSQNEKVKAQRMIDDLTTKINNNMRIANNIVKFGKYKGMPLSSMIYDFYYMSWYVSNNKYIKNDEAYFLGCILTRERMRHYMNDDPLY